jgi:RepB DNA-primase from phage plasmid
MVSSDRASPIAFLNTAYDAGDWVAVFLKTYRTGDVTQRVMRVSTAIRPSFQAWLRHLNRHGWNVYVSVNAVRPGRSRTRQAIASVRHVFLEIDADGPGLLASLTTRPDLPPPSYVLHSSPGRLHVFWRVRGFGREEVELLQKRLARELDTDVAATSCAQTTRLPGFLNHKHGAPWPVFIEYLRPTVTLPRTDFPAVRCPARRVGITDELPRDGRMAPDRLDRARRFLHAVNPAVAGQHGDLRTFRVCCRVVRGFALTDGEAMAVLSDWNARCLPPWSEQELLAKVRNARRYGRERVGALLRAES